MNDSNQAKLMTLKELTAFSEFSNAAFAHVFIHSSSGILITDHKGVIIDGNNAFSRMSGYTQDEYIGKTPRMFLWSGHQDQTFYTDMWKDIEDKGEWYGKIWNKTKSSGVKPFLLSIRRITLPNHLTIYVGVYTAVDMTSDEIPQNIKFHEISS